VKRNYRRKAHKSNHKFEAVGEQELLVRVPLPMAEVRAVNQQTVCYLPLAASLRGISRPGRK